MQVLWWESVKFLFLHKKRRAVARLMGTIRKFRTVAVSRSSLGCKEFLFRMAQTIISMFALQTRAAHLLLDCPLDTLRCALTASRSCPVHRSVDNFLYVCAPACTIAIGAHFARTMCPLDVSTYVHIVRTRKNHILLNNSSVVCSILVKPNHFFPRSFKLAPTR